MDIAIYRMWINLTPKHEKNIEFVWCRIPDIAKRLPDLLFHLR